MDPMDTGAQPNAGAVSNPADNTAGKTGGAADARPYFDPEKHLEKSEFTKLRQKDAKDREDFERKHREREDALTARERQLLQAAQILQQQMQQRQGQNQNDRFSKIREMPYIDGATAAELMESLLNQDIGGIGQAISQRDRALAMLHDRLNKLQTIVDQFQGRAGEQEFGTRLNKVRAELGLPDAPWATEFLKDVYLSHEGDDLADEFPNLARARMDDLRKAFRELDKKTADEARRIPIPSKGGEATPGKKLEDKYKNPRDKASEIFDMFLGGGAASDE